MPKRHVGCEAARGTERVRGAGGGAGYAGDPVARGAGGRRGVLPRTHVQHARRPGTRPIYPSVASCLPVSVSAFVPSARSVHFVYDPGRLHILPGQWCRSAADLHRRDRHWSVPVEASEHSELWLSGSAFLIFCTVTAACTAAGRLLLFLSVAPAVSVAIFRCLIICCQR